MVVCYQRLGDLRHLKLERVGGKLWLGLIYDIFNFEDLC